MDDLRAEEARILVALDFGTTFSGFAYALRAEPKKIYTFYDWPLQALSSSNPYCKTQTSLWYMPKSSQPGCYKLKDWGWPALLNYSEALQSVAAFKAIRNFIVRMIKQLSLKAHKPSAGYFVKRFKLHLANTDSLPEELPPGMRVERAISDYLSVLSQLAMETLKQHFGKHVTKDDVQWCINVPVTWDENAKRRMKTCAEMAGLLAGSACPYTDASLHRLIWALESEAALLYCQQQCSTLKLRKGDKVLLADCGGGTVDIVVHEIVSKSYPHKVQEISRSSGGLCGGGYVDDAFFEFLSRKISCFRQFAKENPAEKLIVSRNWGYYKHVFDGSSCLYSIDLPEKLAKAWRLSDCSCQLTSAYSYHKIDLNEKHMKDIFNPVVDQILALIAKAMPFDISALMMVGGFSSSPYLMRRIKEKFGHRVDTIFVPPCPGKAVCSGAVTLAMSDGFIVSRVSRKTYGISVCLQYSTDDPFEYAFVLNNGKTLCRHHFLVFVHVDEEVPNKHSVSHVVSPVNDDKKEAAIELYSSTKSHPKYITETEFTKEGSFRIAFPSELSLGVRPRIEVRMYFGKTYIKVNAKVLNSGNEEIGEMLPVLFEQNCS